MRFADYHTGTFFDEISRPEVSLARLHGRQADQRGTIECGTSS